MKIFLWSLSLLISSNCLADNKPCQQAAYKAFDFWLGTWTVTMKNGKTAGENKIERLNPCLLLETWEGVKGSKGTSINYYDPTENLWNQHWVSGDGTIIHLKGPAEKETLTLTGTLFNPKEKRIYPFRGTWSLLKDKRVRQFFEQQDTKTKKWIPWFEGYYQRKKDSSQKSR